MIENLLFFYNIFYLFRENLGKICYLKDCPLEDLSNEALLTLIGRFNRLQNSIKNKWYKVNRMTTEFYIKTSPNSYDTYQIVSS